jgi:hypothetical protein
MNHRRLATASLESHVSDPADRNLIPMTTLIGIDANPPSHMWLLETAWDGACIGDVQIFRNENCGPSGEVTYGGDGKPMAAKWVWWGGVPCDKVKSYRFANSDGTIQPQTLEDDTPFELPNAQRKAEPRPAGKPGSDTRPAA